VAISIRLTSTSMRGRIVSRSNARRFSATVISSAAPATMMSQTAGCISGCASAS